MIQFEQTCSVWQQKVPSIQQLHSNGENHLIQAFLLHQYQVNPLKQHLTLHLQVNKELKIKSKTNQQEKPAAEANVLN